MKIALVCTGLGQVWRGYERYTQDLYDLVKNDLEITLLKGGGRSEANEKSFWHLDPKGSIAPLLSKFGRDSYFISNLSYAICVLPHLAKSRYDLVHYSEPGLGNILAYLKEKLKLRFKLLFSNGVGLSPSYCTRPDYLHQLTDPYYEEALEFGFPKKHVWNIPYGLHCRRFSKGGDQNSLRARYGIPEDKIVVLAVSALNRSHKRIDYLIREFERLDHRFFLVVCGNPEDATLLEMANRLIPRRFKFMTVSFSDIPALYRLSDVLVHTALIEGFCLAIVEAMCAELPVLVHHSAHFEWLVGSREGLLDMSKPGELSEKLEAFPRELSRMQPILSQRRQKSTERFDWKNLKSRYLGMYENAAQSNQQGEPCSISN